MSTRREFITLLGGAAAAWPLAVRAQQPGMPVIGFLSAASPEAFGVYVAAFRQGLAQVGYSEGRNVAIAYRWAGGDMSRLPAFAAELVRTPVSLLVGAGLSATLAAKTATTTIPVIFFLGEDPVELGLVDTLNRPGANLTGVTTLNTEVGPKRLELAHELVPSAKLIGLLVNPKGPNAETLTRDMRTAAANLGLTLLVLHAASELDTAFASLAEHRAGALVITTDAFFISKIEELAHLTLRHAVPAIFQYRDFATAGALMSYGGSFIEPYRQVGVYTGRVLKGEKPAELPVQQATKIELFINLKTAKALGLEIPPTLLARADEVIE